MRILYIMGDQRSGTTLVENLIAQLDGALTVGELRLLHGHLFKQGPGDLWDWQCSCGAAIEDCSFWAKTLLRNGNRSLGQTIISKQNLSQSVDTVHSIYKGIQEDEDPALIVDSSKNIYSGKQLRRRIGSDFNILIVRKSFIEVAASKFFHLQKAGVKISPLKLLLATFLFQTRLSFMVWTGYAEGVRYEELLDKPKREAWLASIAIKYGLATDSLPNKMVSASQFHSIAGTPSRFKESEIRPIKKGKQFIKAILPSLRRGQN